MLAQQVLSIVNGVAVTQLKMKALGLAASVHRVANHHVKTNDVILKIPVQRGFGGLSFHVAERKLHSSPSTGIRKQMQQDVKVRVKACSVTLQRLWHCLFTQDMRTIHSILAKSTLIAQRLSVDLLRTRPARVARFNSTQVEDQGYLV